MLLEEFIDDDGENTTVAAASEAAARRRQTSAFSSLASEDVEGFHSPLCVSFFFFTAIPFACIHD